MVKLRHRAKFRGDRSNRGRDMTIFDFRKMAAISHLRFVMFVMRVFGPPTKGICCPYRCAKNWLESMQ